MSDDPEVRRMWSEADCYRRAVEVRSRIRMAQRRRILFWLVIAGVTTTGIFLLTVIGLFGGR